MLDKKANDQTINCLSKTLVLLLLIGGYIVSPILLGYYISINGDYLAPLVFTISFYTAGFLMLIYQIMQIKHILNRLVKPFMMLAILAAYIVPPIMLGYYISIGRDYVAPLMFVILFYGLGILMGIYLLVLRYFTTKLTSNESEKNNDTNVV